MPAASGTSRLSPIVITRRAFSTVFSSVWFPATAVTASNLISGARAASSSAIASSCPGSVSKMIGVGIAPPLRQTAAVSCRACRPRRPAGAVREPPLRDRQLPSQALGRLLVHLAASLIQDDAVLAASAVGGELLFEDVVEDTLGVAVEGVAESAATGLD